MGGRRTSPPAADMGLTLPEPAASPSETPASETPASETPASETPASETPASETPASETPASETPASETPASETPASETPAPEVVDPHEGLIECVMTSIDAGPEGNFQPGDRRWLSPDDDLIAGGYAEPI